MTQLSLFLLILLAIPLGYLLILAFASTRRIARRNINREHPTNRFVIAIPAHNEATIIEATIQTMNKLDYPKNLYETHIAADYCTDHTADAAREAGATVHERSTGPKTGKGAALSWLFDRVVKNDENCDAVIVFDADTRVDPDFLRVMDACLVEGKEVIPALTWAMFMVDNRFQNQGRSNLGLSAKHMGDSICFKANILTKFGWGEGLTEDYHLRQRLLLKNIRISYEPSARGFGEAPIKWSQARTQRARWLRGTKDSSKHNAIRLFLDGIKELNVTKVDGAIQAYFPSYSTLTVISVLSLAGHLLVNALYKPIFPQVLVTAWTVFVLILFVYPLFGLLLERAPMRAYLAILSGPLFIIWRSWVAFRSRYGGQPVTWVRTAHGQNK
jgi:cellulose synthase/poly-beta-1,6-N-acetylglucosamine synthase-like glycosyltransferase